MNDESWKSNKRPLRHLYSPQQEIWDANACDMGREYHSRRAELISIKKGKDYAKTMTWIRGKVSFSILRSALLCLRGSRSNRRRTNNVKDIDVDVELARSNIK